jgi:hypothetical protein
MSLKGSTVAKFNTVTQPAYKVLAIGAGEALSFMFTNSRTATINTLISDFLMRANRGTIAVNAQVPLPAMSTKPRPSTFPAVTAAFSMLTYGGTITVSASPVRLVMFT